MLNYVTNYVITLVNMQAGNLFYMEVSGDEKIMANHPADSRKHARLATYLKALADPTRLHILYLLDSGQYNVSDLARLCGYSQANISRHLTLLGQAGIVIRHQQGTRAYYQLTDPALIPLCNRLYAKLDAMDRTPAS